MSTILIVDDSQTVRKMVAEILRDNGMKVIEAINGLEAKEKILAQVPDLVIADIVMPEMNGYELCRWIRSEPKIKDLPILMCSTKSEEFDRYWGMKQGADAYISKPFHPDDLIKTVKQLLQR